MVTASLSTCPWCPRRSSRCWRAHVWALCTRWSSEDSHRRSSPHASMTPYPRPSSPRRAGSRVAVSCPISHWSTRRAISRRTRRVPASSCSDLSSRQTWGSQTSSGGTPSLALSPSIRSRSRRRILSTSSTPRARRGSRRASCATTGGTPWPWRGACRMSTASARMMSGGPLRMSAGWWATPTSRTPHSSPDVRPSCTRASRSAHLMPEPSGVSSRSTGSTHSSRLPQQSVRSRRRIRAESTWQAVISAVCGASSLPGSDSIPTPTRGRPSTWGSPSWTTGGRPRRAGPSHRACVDWIPCPSRWDPPHGRCPATTCASSTSTGTRSSRSRKATS